VDAGRNLLAIVEPEVWVTGEFQGDASWARCTRARRWRYGWTHIRAGVQGKVDSFQSGTGRVFSLMPPENATGNYVKVVQRVPVKIVFDEDAGAKQLLGRGCRWCRRCGWAGMRACRRR